jgi:hypothetical protein
MSSYSWDPCIISWLATIGCAPSEKPDVCCDPTAFSSPPPSHDSPLFSPAGSLGPASGSGGVQPRRGIGSQRRFPWAQIHDLQSDSIFDFQLVPYHGAGDYAAQPILGGGTLVTATLRTDPSGPDQSVHLSSGSLTVGSKTEGGTVDATGSVALGITTNLQVHATGTWSCPE